MTDPNTRLVYSTDGTEAGRIADKRSRPTSARPQASTPRREFPADGIVRIQREKKGRGGKTVTIVTGLPGTPAALDALLKDLKQSCGAGGAREGSTIEIQGDHRTRIESRLTALGHRVKHAGG
ncbi:MAG: stress response translation initiation inhibitor YciH [Dehalococcoidia bacterium]|nr:MAG: stress response translation initiation inhibitor YciH [Dehalococcoidia bacterium]